MTVNPSSPDHREQRERSALLPSVAAVVVTYENERDTADCLTSLLASDYPIGRIFLVDNGSRDGSIDRLRIRFREDPKLEILCNEENLGYATAANLGIRRAMDIASHVLLINNDAELAAGSLGILVDELSNHPEAGLAVPRIVLSSNPDIVWRGPSRFSWLRAGAIDPERGRVVGRASQPSRCVELATGCVILVRRDTFERVGLFDEGYFLYGEDTDFCLRSREAGICLLYVSQAVARHRVDRTEPTPTSAFTAFHMARSHVLVIRLHARGIVCGYALAVHWLAHTLVIALRATFRGHGRHPVVGWIRGSIEGMRVPIPHPAGRPRDAGTT